MTSRDQMDFEVRFGDVGENGEIEGVAVRFDTVDTYRTSFAPEAFRGLEGRSIPMLWAHDPANVVGSWNAFQVRDGGLTAKGKLNLEVGKAKEVRAMLKAGDISGLSIGFSTVKDERASNGIRRITEARLYEISIVAFPSVPGSGVTKVRFSELNGIEEGAVAFVAACRAATLSLTKGHPTNEA
jgi:HK97 family phage prohead protease